MGLVKTTGQKMAFKDARKDAVEEKSKKKKKTFTLSENAKPLPFKKKGALEQIESEVSEMVTLKMEQGKLQAKTIGNYQQIYPIINKIQNKLGYGGSSSSSGGSTFSYTFDCQKLSGKVESTSRKNEKRVVVRLNETQDDERSLLLAINNSDGSFSFTINGGNLPYLLRLRQSGTGEIIVQELEGSEVYSCSAPSFESLLQVHSEFANDRLLPLMSRFGIGDLITPYDLDVQRQVIALLAKMTEDEKSQFRKFAGNLDDKSYRERTKAAGELGKNVKGQTELLVKVLNDDSFSPEVRYRVQKLIQQQKKSDLLDTMNYVNRSGLTKNRDYLCWLLQRQSEPVSYRRVLNSLSSQAGQTDFSDVSGTQTWMAAQQSAFHSLAGISMTEELSANDPMKETGAIDKAKTSLKAFLRLSMKDDNLSLDRDHFKKLFGGKTIRQLSDEVDALRKKNNLPKTWYRAGGNHSISSSDYQQVHFGLIAEKLGANNNQRHYGGFGGGGIDGGSRSTARDRNAKGSNVQLRMLDSKSRTSTSKRKKSKGQAKKFQFAIEEIRSPYRKIIVTEYQSGRTDFRFVSEKANVIVQLVSSEKGVYVHDIRGSRVFAAEATDLNNLIADHREYFTEKFFPLVEYLGVSVDPVLYGDHQKPQSPKSFWDLSAN